MGCSGADGVGGAASTAGTREGATHPPGRAISAGDCAQGRPGAWHVRRAPEPTDVLEERKGGGVWVRQVCVPHGPTRFSQTVNLVFSRDGHFCLEGGGGQAIADGPPGGRGVGGGGGSLEAMARRCRPPCVTFRLVVVPLRGPGQSPVLPFACCVGLLLSASRCGWCSCWCRFRIRGAQQLVCWGCAECGMVCRLRVSGAQ